MWVLRGATVDTVLRSPSVEFAPAGGPRVLVDGRDVTEALSAGQRAGGSAVPATGDSRLPIAASGSWRAQVRGGRRPGRGDGGLQADCKFFLDASPDARARRRFSEQRAGGGGADLEGIRSAIAARDAADRTRSVAPLAQSADATYVDSSDLTVDEVVELMAKEVERACSTRS